MAGFKIIFEPGGLDPTAAEGCPAFREFDGLHHAVAIKPRVPDVGPESGVGPVLDEQPVEVTRYLPDNGKLAVRDLVEHGCKHAGEVELGCHRRVSSGSSLSHASG